ncbi:hypothetical protein KC19_12G035100 [Ceratodon purpureus]|uniref:Secreted protein n=1 Tax=Ceratodon purpureus TaxID=3225 RepID=A0A8T0G5L0_CERPU|nr:hypothetical protein KC19_12G035100 [Ceratodon purpureus]
MLTSFSLFLHGLLINTSLPAFTQTVVGFSLLHIVHSSFDHWERHCAGWKLEGEKIREILSIMSLKCVILDPILNLICLPHLQQVHRC